MPFFNSWKTVTYKALELRKSQLTVWHSVAFAVNVCAPLLLGWLHYDARMGPLGGILGMLFSLSDAPDKLKFRLFVLGRAAFSVLFFGCVGTLLSGNPVCFWLLLIALAFAAGWMSLSGSYSASVLRNSALALTSASATQGLGFSAVVLVIFAATVVATSRSAGQIFLHDETPVLASPSPKERPEIFVCIRYCSIYAAAVALALAIGNWQGVNRPLWVATTVLLVMQPDAESSYQRILQRLLGTCVGVAIANFIVHTVHSETLLALSAGVISFVLPQGSTRNYWLHSAFAAGLVLVLLDFGISGENFDIHLLGERIRDVVVGCLIVVIATLAAFPPHLHKTEVPAT